MEIGTVVARGEKVWQGLTQQVVLERVSAALTEEGMIGSVGFGVSQSLQAWRHERMKWRISK